MSQSQFIPGQPVRKPSNEQEIAAIKARLGLLERNPVGGRSDYVFLTEIEQETTARYFSTSIEAYVMSSYRHLVFEISLAAVRGSQPATGYQPVDLILELYSIGYGQSPQFWWNGAINPSVATAEEPTGGSEPLVLKEILTFSEFSHDYGDPWTTMELKLENVNDAGRSVSGFWRATAPVAAPDIDSAAAYNNGGLFYEDGPTNLSDIYLSAAATPFLSNEGAWSNVTAYVVGDFVDYAALPATHWVCVDANTNEVPSMASTFWTPYYPPIVEGSKMSIYGIR